MKYKQSGLLTLLISLFLFNACKNPGGVGLDVDPEDQIMGVLTDTSSIRSSTVREDSILTSSLSEYPLGYLKDPEMGTTVSDIATYLTLGATANVTFGTSPTLDSAVLVLKLGNEFYGDTVTSSYVIQVHQLSNKFDKSTPHYSTGNFAFNSSVVGSKTFTKFKLKDSVVVQNIIAGKKDTTKKVAPQIRIPLTAAFANANFLNASSSNFVSDETFLTHLKGLYITINKTSSTGRGGIAFFDLSSGSQVELFYKKQNTAGTGRDTVSNVFPTRNGAASIKHDYTGTNVLTQLNNPNQQFTKTYTQALAGLRTKIKFPYLTNIKALGNVIVNRAELVVNIENGSDTPLPPATRLFLYRTDIAGQRQLVPDASTTDVRQLTDFGFGGYYDSSKKRYIFTITSYIQDIISGRSVQYDTYIAPAEPGLDRTSAFLPSATTGGRSVLTSPTNTGLKMKLNIYYTKVN